jgi:hypothetical protein
MTKKPLATINQSKQKYFQPHMVGENYHEPLAIAANDVEVEQIHLPDQIGFSSSWLVF